MTEEFSLINRFEQRMSVNEPKSSTRVLAAGVDSFIYYCFGIFGAQFGATLAVAAKGPASPEVLESAITAGSLFGLLFWGGVGWFLNSGIMAGLTGGSVGKRVFSLSVVNIKGKPLGIFASLNRSMLLIVSFAFFGFGFLYFYHRRCAFHDKILRTKVVTRKPTRLRLLPGINSDASSRDVA